MRSFLSDSCSPTLQISKVVFDAVNKDYIEHKYRCNVTIIMVNINHDKIVCILTL